MMGLMCCKNESPRFIRGVLEQDPLAHCKPNDLIGSRTDRHVNLAVTDGAASKTFALVGLSGLLWIGHGASGHVEPPHCGLPFCLRET